LGGMERRKERRGLHHHTTLLHGPHLGRLPRAVLSYVSALFISLGFSLVSGSSVFLFHFGRDAPTSQSDTHYARLCAAPFPFCPSFLLSPFCQFLH
jgi:hypothetical protein